MKRAPVTFVLLALIAIVFAVELKLGLLHSPIVPFRLGAVTHDTLRRGEYWRLLATMFLHGNWLHVLANSWSLFQLGRVYEDLFSSRRFAIVYFATGLIASAASSLHLPPNGVAVGASGALMGILGALITSILRSRHRRERWAKFLLAQLVFWGIVAIVIGFQIPEIDNTAHIAGLTCGLLLGLIPQQEAPPPPPSEVTVDVAPQPSR